MFIFDFETTGFLFNSGDRVVQMCIFPVWQEYPISFHVQSDREVSDGALNAHGITTQFANQFGVSQETAWRFLLGIARDHPGVGHNIHNFDCGFIDAACRRHNLPFPNWDHWIDTAAVWKAHMMHEPIRGSESNRSFAQRILSIRVKGLKFNLAHVANELGIEVQQTSLHDAAYDCIVTRKVYHELSERGILNQFTARPEGSSSLPEGSA